MTDEQGTVVSKGEGLVVWRCPNCEEQLYGLFAVDGWEGACPFCEVAVEGERIPVIPKSEAEQLVWKMGEQLREADARYEALEAREQKQREAVNITIGRLRGIATMNVGERRDHFNEWADQLEAAFNEQ